MRARKKIKRQIGDKRTRKGGGRDLGGILAPEHRHAKNQMGWCVHGLPLTCAPA